MEQRMRGGEEQLKVSSPRMTSAAASALRWPQQLCQPYRFSALTGAAVATQLPHFFSIDGAKDRSTSPTRCWRQSFPCSRSNPTCDECAVSRRTPLQEKLDE